MNMIGFIVTKEIPPTVHVYLILSCKIIRHHEVVSTAPPRIAH
jgi:hypothetical protein